MPSLLILVIAFFPISEIALAASRRSRGQSGQSEDRGSMRRLWLSIGLGLGLAALSLRVPAAHIGWPSSRLENLALGLLVFGLAVRWTAILTLGRYFTVDVAILSDHVVVERGLYRFVRHPSYTGLLIAFLGLGFFFENWLSLAALMIPITAAVCDRVLKEERALLASLGPAYARYCSRTKRFLPGVL